MKTYHIGIDVGGSNVRIGIVGEDLKVYHADKIKSSEVAPRFKSFILDYFNKYKNTYNITAISLGYPGVVDDGTKEVLNIPNQKAFETKTYIKEIIEETNVPVFIDNDVNHLLVNDVHKLGIKDENILGFYIGTGFGNGIILNHKLFYGDNSYAGELGHIPVIGNNEVCGCGKIGCIETIASGVYLNKIYNQYFSHLVFEDMFTKHSDHPALKQLVENIGVAVATEMIILDVNAIVLGGGVINAVDFPRKDLEAVIKSKLRSKENQDRMKVYYADSAIEDGIIGASLTASLKLGNN